MRSTKNHIDKSSEKRSKITIKKKTLKNRFRFHLNKFEGIDRPKRMILFSERSNLIYGNLGTNLNNVNSTTFVKKTDKCLTRYFNK